MPRPSHRTKGSRRIWVRTPGGRTVVHYRKKKTNPAVCWVCGRQLAGVPRVRPSKLRALARSSRRPNRPYGGNLCPRCMRRAIKTRVRAG